MKSPVTDKNFDIPHSGRHDDKFRSVRSKAKVEERERKTKARRDKKLKTPKPKYSVGDEVVLTSGHSKRYYYLAEVLDFDYRWVDEFIYFGILKKTTDPEKIDRIGRLLVFGEHSWFREYNLANVPNEKINWEVDR